MAENTLITKREFELYEQVRVSGITNMMATERVKDLSGLSRKTILVIMDSYSDLMEKYPEVRKK